MSPRIKWGLIAGGGVAILNLCGGGLIGAFNNCLSVITVSLAAALAGYFCARQESAAEAVRAGATAGALIGVFNLVSQLVGGVMGGLIGAGLLTALSPSARTGSAAFTQGLGLGLGIIVGAAVVVGGLLILVGAGVGALTAKLAVPSTIA